MTGDLFKEWVKKLEKILLVGNCPAQPQTEILSNVNIIFLALNSTSVLQPSDQEVIRSLKIHYRREVIVCGFARFLQFKKWIC